MKKTVLTLIVSVCFLTTVQSQQSNVGFGQSQNNAKVADVWYDINISQGSANYDTNSNFYLQNDLRAANPEIFKKNDDDSYDIDFKNIKGSPYVSNSYLFGHVTDEISHKSVNIYLRYNIYNDIIELKASLEKGEKTIALLKKHDISCVINGKTYNYLNFTDKKGTHKNGYLKLLYKGKKYSLYERLTSVFTSKKKAQNSYTKSKPASFSKKVSYYLRKENKVTFLPNKKKDLLSSFPELNKTLKSYIKRVHPNFKKENDVLNFVKYLNSSNPF